MLRKFNEYINESNGNKQVVYYHWLDYFKNTWYDTKCEVISHTDKTAVIKLLEPGKNGARPGTQIRVHLNSLKGFNNNKPKREPDTSWRKYTDPDLEKDDGDEINESKNPMERESEAKNLVEQAKKYFKDGDMENAGKIWCEIYDLYEDMYDEDKHTEQDRMKLFSDFQEIMRSFTDDEVFGITEHLKKQYYKE